MITKLLLIMTTVFLSAPLLAEDKPAPLIKYQFAPEELYGECRNSISVATKRLVQIPMNPAKTFESTILEFEDILADFNDAVQPLTFMNYVSQNETTRREASACEEDIGVFMVSVYSEKPIYEALKVGTPRNAAETRLRNEILRDFEKDGMNLPDDKLEEVKTLKERLTVLETKFSTNLNEDKSTISFTEAQLDGVPSTFLKRLQKVEGRYVVTTKSPDYTDVMQNAKNPETRRLMQLAYFNRAAEENTKLLEEAVLIRQRLATLLGFNTWADYRTQGRMAKDAQSVLRFLKGLKGKLAVRNRADLDELLAFKKSMDPAATSLDAWDVMYYSYQLKKSRYALNDEQIREYFPADVVVKGMFDVYSKLLGVKYVPVTSPVWASGVKLYQIREKKGDKLIAHFYADFIPREGKYGHAAAFTLIGGRATEAGYNLPISSIVANFNPPSGEKPSLLNHDEVETLFHEFGHIMHQTLTRAPYASLSGSRTVRDFVEAPSQMLENWVWDEGVLKSLSGHYANPKKKLPRDLLKKMLSAKDFNQGYFYTRQLLLGLFDMELHTAQGPVDVTALYDRMHLEFTGIPSIPSGHYVAGFGHMMGGYDAGYYGYLWSAVYAADMFTRFDKEGLRSSRTGAAYRKAILEKGNMNEAIELVREFLGREPNAEAFYKQLGIE